MVLTILFGGIACLKAKTRSGVFGGWALIACVSGALQFVLLWSGFSFKQSSEITAIAFGATVAPVFTTLFICYVLAGVQSTPRQVAVPSLAWILLVLWLVI
ncbi:hypothetical protein Enr13x_54880 [Stieleria neptunia]|uniref:Uncharacterized protein n=2 Tax=Stieleria neptunia TaxID=2527979 RepID=A0A518HXM4_9BACT|nr:hypothetical protein Enr13x_54880 [Stieleria neptunia]